MKTINVSLSSGANKLFNRLYEMECHLKPVDFMSVVKDYQVRALGTAQMFLELKQAGLISQKREGVRILAIPGRRVNQSDPFPQDDEEVIVPKPKRPATTIPGDDWTTNTKGMGTKKLKKLVKMKNEYTFTRTKFPNFKRTK